MAYKINESFLIIVYESKLNKMDKDTAFNYLKGEVIDENNEKFKILDDVIWNNLLIRKECQVFADIPEMFRAGNIGLKNIEILDSDELEDENRLKFSWVEEQ